MSRHEVTTRRVLYEIPGMQSIKVREESFTGADGQPLPMKIYGNQGPIVVILGGFPDAGVEKHVGCKFMEMEWAISTAQLIAASGMTAVTHSNRDSLPDANALLDQLTATGNPIGIWTCSGNGPVALKAAAKVRCSVFINPITEDFCPETPLFVVRCGKDETSGLNAALDLFTAKAIADNRPLTLVNYADAQHAFDIRRDGAETRRILQQGLDFLRAHFGLN